MNTKTISNPLKRAFELDFLRGLAIIMMMLHHFIYDLRYVIGLDVFAIQDTYFFIYWIRAPFVFIFLFVSGICCSFSKNNFVRSAKMAAAAVLFSVVFLVVSIYTKSQMYVIFNVLHILAVGTLLYAVLSFLETKFSFKGVNYILIFAGIFFLWLSYPLSALKESFIPALVPVFDVFAYGIGMADYMPLIPWFGMFLFGALFGRLYYSQKKSVFLNASKQVLAVSKPFEFVGRNALLFYVFHQPMIIGVLFLLEFVGLIKT